MERSEWRTAPSGYRTLEARVRYRLRAIGTGQVRILFQHHERREITRLTATEAHRLWVEFELPRILDGEQRESWAVEVQTDDVGCHWSIRRADLAAQEEAEHEALGAKARRELQEANGAE